MFQTQRPSGRRRLLLLLVIVFAVTVFGMRYLLVTLGWVGGQTDTSPTKTIEQEQQELAPSQSTIDPSEMVQIKTSTESFIKRYTQHDLMKSDQWFQSFQQDLHPNLVEVIRLEAERSRPTMMVQKTHFKQLHRSTCDAVGEKAHCYLEVTVETIDSQQQATLVDKIYEVILSAENENWKIEGLNIHGSLD